MAFYSDERASVYTGLDSNKSPWISDVDLQTYGGVILWRAGPYEEELLTRLHERFPQALYEKPIVLPWQSSAEIERAEIRIAVIPPETPTAPMNEVQLTSGTTPDSGATTR